MSMYKWFKKLDQYNFGLHVDYIQIPGAKIRDLLIALKTEYLKEDRPMDILVDIFTMTVPETEKDVKTLKSWVMQKNSANTCAFCHG